MLAQGLYRLGVAPEKPGWYRVGGEWVWGTSAQIMQAEKAAEETIAAWREQFDELAAESLERTRQRLRDAVQKMHE